MTTSGASHPAPTVRDATIDVLRRHDLTTLFANPGSTEIPFLTGLPVDIRFVLGLHESAVVGMATGHALATGRPALVNLHTVAGLANAAGALATARQCEAPLVVLVGLQDRRHLDLEPFLSGPVQGLAGSYPVWVHQPPRAQDVPGAVARAIHLSMAPEAGPALVLVPMDDWTQDLDDPPVLPAPARLRRASTAAPEAVQEVADRLLAAARPALVAGAGADDPVSWSSLAALADMLRAPVWQEAFGARAGFAQDHPLFAGHLPAGRDGLRRALAAHDLVLVVGAPAFRQYPYEPGALVPPETTVLQLTASATHASRSVADLSLVTPVPEFCAALRDEVRRRRPVSDDGGSATVEGTARVRRPEPHPPRLSLDGPLTPGHLFRALATRLPAEAVLVEESPSSGPLLRQLVPARAPGGRFSAAGGGLGFALPAAIGLRMAQPHRPVVCVLGDGSSLYSVQALWSAARYGVGVLFVVLANGRYAIMDRLAARHAPATPVPWPPFGEISVQQIAGGFGCPSLRVGSRVELAAALDDVVPTLADRSSPLLLDVAVEDGD